MSWNKTNTEAEQCKQNEECNRLYSNIEFYIDELYTPRKESQSKEFLITNLDVIYEIRDDLNYIGMELDLSFISDLWYECSRYLNGSNPTICIMMYLEIIIENHNNPIFKRNPMKLKKYWKQSCTHNIEYFYGK